MNIYCRKIDGVEEIEFHYGPCKATAREENGRWRVKVQFFYATGRQCGDDLDYIYPNREGVFDCFTMAKEICDRWVGGVKC